VVDKKLKIQKISTRVQMTSLVAILGEPPVSFGNYCSVKEGYLVNMWAENLEALQEQLGDKMEAYKIGNNYYWVMDPRIPKDYLHEKPCFTGSGYSITKKLRTLAAKLSWEHNHGPWPEDYCGCKDDREFFEKDPEVNVTFPPYMIEISCPICGEVWAKGEIGKPLPWKDKEYFAGLPDDSEPPIIMVGYKFNHKPESLGVTFSNVEEDDLEVEYSSETEMLIAPQFLSTEPLDLSLIGTQNPNLTPGTHRLKFTTTDSKEEKI